MFWIIQLSSPRRAYRDLSDELREHLLEKTEELIAKGRPPREAEEASRREFGERCAHRCPPAAPLL
jgi:hypothetical protein